MQVLLSSNLSDINTEMFWIHPVRSDILILFRTPVTFSANLDVKSAKSDYAFHSKSAVREIMLLCSYVHPFVLHTHPTLSLLGDHQAGFILLNNAKTAMGNSQQQLVQNSTC